MIYVNNLCDDGIICCLALLQTAPIPSPFNLLWWLLLLTSVERGLYCGGKPNVMPSFYIQRKLCVVTLMVETKSSIVIFYSVQYVWQAWLWQVTSCIPYSGKWHDDQKPGPGKEKNSLCIPLPMPNSLLVGWRAVMTTMFETSGYKHCSQALKFCPNSVTTSHLPGKTNYYCGNEDMMKWRVCGNCAKSRPTPMGRWWSLRVKYMTAIIIDMWYYCVVGWRQPSGCVPNRKHYYGNDVCCVMRQWWAWSLWLLKQWPVVTWPQPHLCPGKASPIFRAPSSLTAGEEVTHSLSMLFQCVCVGIAIQAVSVPSQWITCGRLMICILDDSELLFGSVWCVETETLSGQALKLSPSQYAPSQAWKPAVMMTDYDFSWQPGRQTALWNRGRKHYVPDNI